MDKNLKLRSVHLCAGARFDRNGGISALGIMSPSVGSSSFPLVLNSFSIIGHAWNLSDEIREGKLLIVPPKGQKTPFSEVSFKFSPTGREGSVFIIQYPGICVFEAEGSYGFEVEAGEGARKRIYSLKVKKLPPQ